MKKIAAVVTLSLVLASPVMAATQRPAPRPVTPIDRITRIVKKILNGMLSEVVEIKPTITIP